MRFLPESGVQLAPTMDYRLSLTPLCGRPVRTLGAGRLVRTLGGGETCEDVVGGRPVRTLRGGYSKSCLPLGSLHSRERTAWTGLLE